MELAFSLDYLKKQRGTSEPRDFQEMASLCRGAGFRYVDYSPEFRAEDWLVRAQRASP